MHVGNRILERMAALLLTAGLWGAAAPAALLRRRPVRRPVWRPTWCPAVGATRGDVPGWVLITLMSAVLVAGLLALAGPALQQLFNQAMQQVQP